MADETAILAGGCFWCTEAIFLDLYGVKSVESGYIGGDVIALAIERRRIMRREKHVGQVAKA